MSKLVELYKQEQEILLKIQRESPSALNAEQIAFAVQLKLVGIELDFGFLPQGYLYLYPQDFIVEEINRDGHISRINFQKNEIPSRDDQSKTTLYCQMIKVGHSTMEAVELLAKALQIPIEEINYAGLKDKTAITAQEISINNADAKKIANLKLAGIYLQNFHWEQGNTYKGNLKGNEFTIVVRTPATLGQGWLDSATKKLQNGFYNFYYLQRFGTPRLVSHHLGKELLRGDFQKAVEIFLYDTGLQNVPLLNELREQAKAATSYADKAAVFAKLPYSLRLEQQVCEHLQEHAGDYLGALKTLEGQMNIWVHSYSSYLFNKHLSKLIAEDKKIPKRLPLLLNPKYQQIDTYALGLKADGISDLNASLNSLFGKEMLKFKNTCATMAFAKIKQAQILDKALVLNFSLPIGSYATTFLSHFFTVVQGRPVPNWVDTAQHDSLQILNRGSLTKFAPDLLDFQNNNLLELNFN